MYRKAHQLMALATASMICTLLCNSIALIVVLVLCSIFIAIFPDLDMKLGLKHRGKVSHNPFGWFALLTIIFGILLFYLLAFIDHLVSFPLFGAELYLGFPIFFVKLVTNPLNAIFDPFIVILLVFYLCYISHLVLDSVTKSGIEWWGKSKLRGDYYAKDKRINVSFVLFGTTILVLSAIFIVLKFVIPSSPLLNYYWYVVVTGIACIVLIVLVANYLIRQRKEKKCVYVNGKKVCLRKTCINIDGKIICPSDFPENKK
jgi:hypothetical protein